MRMPNQSFKFVYRTASAICLLGICVSAVRADTIPSICDDLIVTDSLLLTQAKRLADFRNSFDGDDVDQACVITMGDLNRSFSNLKQPAAQVLAAARQQYEMPGKHLRYLTLFGDASFQPGSNHQHVPTFGFKAKNYQEKWENVSVDAAYARFVACDSCITPNLDTLPFREDFYAKSSDSEKTESDDPILSNAPKVQFAVGRIPAHTLADAKIYVDKVIAYETQFDYGPWSHTFAFINDDDRRKGSLDGRDPFWWMPGMSQDVWNKIESKPFVRRVASIETNPDANGINWAARDSLLKIWNQGAAFLFFTGNCNPDRWSDESIFELKRDLDLLRPGHRLPVVISIGPPTVPFATDSIVTMGEVLLFHPQGAIAFLGTTFENYFGPNIALTIAWTSSLPAGPTPLGLSFYQAFSRDRSNGTFNDHTWSYIGDPALTVHRPGQSLTSLPKSTRAHPRFDAQGLIGDSVVIEIVRIDTITDKDYGHFPDTTEVSYSWHYERETILHREFRHLKADENEVSFTLADTLNPNRHVVRVMSWNARESRYLRKPLSGFPLVEVMALHRLIAPNTTRTRRVLLTLDGGKMGFGQSQAQRDALGRGQRAPKW